MKMPFHSAASLMLTVVASCSGQNDGGSSDHAITSGSSLDGATMTASSGSSNDGGPSSDRSSFPFGVYSDCTWLLTGGSFESAASSASLTLAPDGSSVVATFQSEGQPTATFDLHATSDRSATLSASGQGFQGEWGFCGGSVIEFDSGGGATGSPASTQATLSMTSAELTVDRGVVFVQMDGAIVDVQGQPGCAPDAPLSPPVSALLVCDASGTSDGGNSGDDAAEPASASSSFVTGSYNCTSSVSTVVTYEGDEDNSGRQGAGSLMLTVDGSSLKAAYSGDTYASASLDFAVTSDSSANPVPGQTIDVACGGIDPTTLMFSNGPTVTQVSAGSLTTDGTTLYLTILGTVPSGSCSGQTSSTVLQCTLK